MDATPMPRYDVRNDGSGPYAVFYCDVCTREFRTRPNPINTLGRAVGNRALGGLLRNIPVVGHTMANQTTYDNPRYATDLTPQQLEDAWRQMQDRLRQCPTCGQFACPSCFDAQSGTCMQDSPRADEIAQQQGEQAAGVIKGIASVFGVGDAIKNVAEEAQKAQASMIRCPKDGTLAPVGTKFCPECGSPMPQAVADACPNCGTDAKGAKFCPECGTRMERAAAAPATCRSCGAELNGAKFCPECGTRAAG